MTSQGSGDRQRTPDEILAAYKRLPEDKKKFVTIGMKKFISTFKEMWTALKLLLAEHSTDWSIGDDDQLHFTPVILEACPGCGKLFSDAGTQCYQPDPAQKRTDWMIRRCETKGKDIYANGEAVDDIWDEA